MLPFPCLRTKTELDLVLGINPIFHISVGVVQMCGVDQHGMW